MAHRLLRDVEADGWERSDFPIICESCLGDNPYVRMTKADYDKECKICTRPFSVFRWRPGRDARYKKTEVCQTCSKLKNVCQVCLLDLEYGLPVQVRDTALSINSNDTIPKSDVNREYFAEEHDRRARAGIEYESSYGKARPNDTILKLQRTTPYYKRNRAHVCSFYIRGECTRGAECPYRHEMPVTGELSQQNIKDRYYGVNDPVALKLLNKAGDMPSLAPPEDENIKTLYIGGLDARISEQDLRDQFYVHGEIESIRFVPQRACAFVAYTTRAAAEKAAEELSNKLVVKGLRLKLMWGRPQAPKPESENQDDLDLGATGIAHGGLLPRSLISQQQSQQPHPPGTQDQQPYHNYFNIPAPPQPERTFYPSMDPQRMGAAIPSQEASVTAASGSGDIKAGPEKQSHHLNILHIPAHHGLLKVSTSSHFTHHMGTSRHHLFSSFGHILIVHIRQGCHPRHPRQMSNSRSRYSSHSRSPYWDRSSCLSSISRSRSRSSFRSHESSDVENPGHNLYVTGLSPRVTMRDLEKHFSSEGTVVDIHLVLDPWTRESRGFGFVAMATVKDADRCLKYLDQSVLKGRKIMVEKARRRRGRTPTPGRYLCLKSARAVRHRSPSYSPPRGRTSNSPAYYYGRDRSYSPCCRRYRSRSRSSDRSYSPYNRGVHASSRYYREDRSHSPYYRRYRSRSRSCSYTPCRRRRYNLSHHYSRRDLSYSPSNRRYRSPYRSLSPPHYSRSHVGRRRERSCSSHSVSKSYSQSPTPHYHCSRRYRSISPSMSPRGRRNGRRSCSKSDSPRRGRRSYSRSDSARQWRQNSDYSSASSRLRSVSDSVSPARHNYSGGRSWSGNPCVPATLARFHHLGDPSLSG